MRKYLKIIYGFMFYSHPIILILHNFAKFFSKKRCIILSNLFWYWLYHKCHIMISPRASIGKSVVFPHPMGIVIGDGVKIGENVTIYQNVTIGRKYIDKEDYPIIEENVIIYPNSVVAGKILVRRNTVIGANSVLLTDTEENSTYAGNPAKRIK